MSGTADSHESLSSARPPSTASVDGWEVESSSAEQPTNEQLAERLRDEPSAEKPDASAESAGSEHDDLDNDAPDRETPADEAPKKRKLTAAERKAVLQAEFNALTRQREDARRAFEAEEAERQRARTARGDSRATAQAEDKVPDTPEEAGKIDVVEGQPDWDAYEAEGKTFSQYQKDLTAFFKAEAIREAKAAAASMVSSMLKDSRERELTAAEMAKEDARREAAIAKFPDWAEKIEANLGDVDQTPFLATVVRRHPAGMDLLYHLADHPAETKILSTYDWTRPFMDAMKMEPDPAPLLLYLAHHQEEQERIAHLDPVPALLALGRISAELSRSDAKTGSSERTPPVTSAKPPIRPLGATRTASGSQRDPDDLDFGPEYIRAELAARAARMRR